MKVTLSKNSKLNKLQFIHTNESGNCVKIYTICMQLETDSKWLEHNCAIIKPGGRRIMGSLTLHPSWCDCHGAGKLVSYFCTNLLSRFIQKPSCFCMSFSIGHGVLPRKTCLQNKTKLQQYNFNRMLEAFTYFYIWLIGKNDIYCEITYLFYIYSSNLLN